MRALRLLSVAIAMLSNNGIFTFHADAVSSDSDPHPDVLASDLLEWLRANDAYINEKLVVKHLVPNDPSSPRGIFTTDAMDAGEIVCEIPSKLIVKSSEELMEGLPRLPTGNAHCGVIKAVMKAMSGDDITPYGRYLLAQPKGYTAKFWSQAGRDLLSNMLKSTRTHELTKYDELPPHGVYDAAEDLEAECHGDIDDPFYLQAAMLVDARSDYDVMVPFYDMINHHNGKYNIRHNYDTYKESLDETGYEIATTKAIQAGGELYNSYNGCTICYDWLDHFGTPEVFMQFGFVEPMPQRWLFDFARVKFDLDWKNADEATGEVVVNFLVPPSEKGMHLLQEELSRLKSFSTMHRNKSYEDYEGVSKYEWESLWQYYDALHYALSNALQSDVTLSDDVWDLDDDWWVKDGAIVAADVYEHYVLPTRSDKTFNDEL